MKSKCEIERFPHRYTLSVRFRSSVGELPERFAAAYDAVTRLLSERGGKASGPPFAIYHAMDPQGLDVEAGVPVERPLSGSGEVRAGELPGGRSATTVYTGPYRSIGVAYDALSTWVEAHGLQPNGDPCEFYLNDPSSTPAEQLQTKLVMPIRDSRSRSRSSEYSARPCK
jgi:effector-binding domain-containing protein